MTHALTELLKKTNDEFKNGFGDWSVLYRKGHAGLIEEFTAVEKQFLLTLTHGLRCNVGECYKNAQQIAMRMIYDDRLQYVEGLVTVHGVPIHHAWLEHNLKVFDPTLDSRKTWRRKEGHEPGEYYGMIVPKWLIYKNQLRMETYSPLTQWPSPYARRLMAEREKK